jgi:cell shape-determining protein MreD
MRPFYFIFYRFAADLVAGVMGPHMRCYGLLGVLLNQTGRMLIMKRAVYKAVIVFLVFLATETAAYWLSVLKVGETRQSVTTTILLTGLYSAVICPLIWSVLSALSGWSNLQQNRSDWTHH